MLNDYQKNFIVVDTIHDLILKNTNIFQYLSRLQYKNRAQLNIQVFHLNTFLSLHLRFLKSQAFDASLNMTNRRALPNHTSMWSSFIGGCFSFLGLSIAIFCVRVCHTYTLVQLSASGSRSFTVAKYFNISLS